MTADSSSARYQVVDLKHVPAQRCPCGQAKRAFTEDPDRIASMHVVDISTESRVHYHRHMTELYYILEGTGHMELDGDRIPVRPGSAILIKPECRHRVVGSLKVLNVPVPAFDPQDEWFDD